MEKNLQEVSWGLKMIQAMHKKVSGTDKYDIWVF